MLYIKLTFQYIKKHFFQLLLFSIIPALLIVLTSRQNNILNYLVEYPKLKIENFGDVYFRVTETSLLGFLYLFLSSLVVCFFFGSMSGIIEKDMRLGIFSIRGTLKYANNNFINSFIISLIFYFILIVFGVLISTFFYLFSFSDSIKLSIALCSVTFLILAGGMVVLYLFLIPLFPTMVFTGLPLHKSVPTSIKTAKKRFFKLLVAVFLPMIPAFVLNFFDTFFHWYAHYVINFFVLSFLIMYYICLMFVCYFEANQIEREDLKTVMLWDKKGD